jgi:hypothetical protein
MSRKIENLVERYLGTSSPIDFDSIEEINDYFEVDSLIEMFGNMEFDMGEVHEIRNFVIEEWKLSNDS